MDCLGSGVLGGKARAAHRAEKAHRPAEPVAGKRVYPYDFAVGSEGPNGPDQRCWTPLPRFAGEDDLLDAQTNGKSPAELVDREPTFQVVTGSASVYDVRPPLAATADRHLVLSLEWPLSPAAIPAGSALEPGRAIVQRKRVADGLDVDQVIGVCHVTPPHCHSATAPHNFRERAGNQFNDVATVFFDASVWEEDGAAEVAELGLTKGTRVTVEGVWSKRTRTTKDGQLRINDVLTARKIRLLTETEISATDVDGDDVEYDEATPEPSDLKEPAA
jgi:hypothetical protein